jgi:DNA polymerase
VSYCLIDFETAGPVDLKKAGAAVYAEDPATEVICLSYQAAAAAAPSIMFGAELFYRPDHPLALLIANDAILFCAHNVLFEKMIWRKIMTVSYGWPDIPNKRWHCTQSVCAMKVLPLGLEKAAVVLRLQEQKDKIGSALVKALSKPRKDGSYDRSEATLSRVYEYCRQDVRAEVELLHRVGPLQASERNVWLLDQRINERGVRIDPDFVSACETIVDQAMRPLLAELSTLTGGLAVGQRDKILKWVQARGVNPGTWETIEGERKFKPNLRKETIIKLLGESIHDSPEEDDDSEDPVFDDDTYGETPLFAMPDDVRRVLDIRRVAGSASIKKLKAIRACIGSDGRVRGAVQYHGAGTGRWAGRLFQPHNFPRPTLKHETWNEKTNAFEKVSVDWQLVYDAIMSGDAEYVALLYGDPIETVISGLRNCIIASPGRDLNVGDFARIEACIVLAFAGQDDKLALLNDPNSDVYIDMAQVIYKCTVDKKKDPEKRTVGKQTVLGSGFQMGAAKFQKQYAPHMSLDFCKGVIAAYRTEWAPEVPKLWYGLEEAACKTAWDRTPHEAYGVHYQIEDMWMTARLPSGRKLYYANPTPVKKAMPWDDTDIRAAWTFNAQKMGRWRTVDAFGGLLTENVASGSARDLLTHAMFQCERENLPVVLTVHDEIVAEPLTAHSDAHRLEQIMQDRPRWAIERNVPVFADCWAGDRYRK